MRNIISKELLSEVLKTECFNIRVLPRIVTYSRYEYDKVTIDCQINIYELVHKCKMWSLRYAEIKTFETRGTFPLTTMMHIASNGKWIEEKQFRAENIFQPYEWLHDRVFRKTRHSKGHKRV